MMSAVNAVSSSGCLAILHCVDWCREVRPHITLRSVAPLPGGQRSVKSTRFVIATRVEALDVPVYLHPRSAALGFACSGEGGKQEGCYQGSAKKARFSLSRL
jgi:hypothetical protein